MMTFTHCAVEV